MTLDAQLLEIHGDYYRGAYYLNDRIHQQFTALNETLGLMDNGDDFSIPQEKLDFVQSLIRENDGNTMLHLAVIADNSQLVSALLKSELNPFLRNKDGKTAVQLAMEQYEATQGDQANNVRRAHLIQILTFFVNQQCLIEVNGELPENIPLLRQVAMGNLVSKHETAQENIFDLDSFIRQSDPLVGRWGLAAMDKNTLALIKHRLHQYYIANQNNHSMGTQTHSTLDLIEPILNDKKLTDIPLFPSVSRDSMHSFPDNLNTFVLNGHGINAVPAPAPNEIEAVQENILPVVEREVILADMTIAAQIAALKKAYYRLLTDGRAVLLAEYKTALEDEQRFLRTYLHAFSHSGFLSLTPQQLGKISAIIVMIIAILSGLLGIVLLIMALINTQSTQLFNQLRASALRCGIVLGTTPMGAFPCIFIASCFPQKTLRELFTSAAKAEKITADLAAQLRAQYPDLPEVLNFSVLQAFGEDRLNTVTKNLERLSARAAEQRPQAGQKNQVGVSEQARFFKILEPIDHKRKTAKVGVPSPNECTPLLFNIQGQ